MIKLDDLPDQLKSDIFLTGKGTGLKEIVAAAEKQAIDQALDKANGDKVKAAALLRIGKSSFYEKLKKYNYKHSGNLEYNPK